MASIKTNECAKKIREKPTKSEINDCFLSKTCFTKNSQVFRVGGRSEIKTHFKTCVPQVIKTVSVN